MTFPSDAAKLGARNYVTRSRRSGLARKVRCAPMFGESESEKEQSQVPPRLAHSLVPFPPEDIRRRFSGDAAGCPSRCQLNVPVNWATHCRCSSGSARAPKRLRATRHTRKGPASPAAAPRTPFHTGSEALRTLRHVPTNPMPRVTVT